MPHMESIIPSNMDFDHLPLDELPPLNTEEPIIINSGTSQAVSIHIPHSEEPPITPGLNIKMYI